MSAFVASYFVSIGAMLFAGSCALTFFFIVRHLDPSEEPTSVRAPLAEAVSLEEEVRERVPA
jgi:hypothetical protein